MIIFRNDDVSPASNLLHICSMYETLKKIAPDCEIWNCVNIFAKINEKGSVYPDLPLSNKPKNFFYDVNSVWSFGDLPTGKTVSHGLLHNDHTNLSPDAQETSIVASCRALGTDIFVPPFSRSDANMKRICSEFGIHMTDPSDGWKSLESDPFDPTHDKWFFHSWRFTPESFKKLFVNIGEKIAA